MLSTPHLNVCFAMTNHEVDVVVRVRADELRNTSAFVSSGPHRDRHDLNHTFNSGYEHEQNVMVL